VLIANRAVAGVQGGASENSEPKGQYIMGALCAGGAGRLLSDRGCLFSDHGARRGAWRLGLGMIPAVLKVKFGPRI